MDGVNLFLLICALFAISFIPLRRRHASPTFPARAAGRVRISEPPVPPTALETP